MGTAQLSDVNLKLGDIIDHVTLKLSDMIDHFTIISDFMQTFVGLNGKKMMIWLIVVAWPTSDTFRIWLQ